MTGIELLRMYAETRPRQAIAADCQLPNVLGKDCDDFGSCNDCHRFVCNAIADQIERETLSRPRFDDGEPVQWGDEYESCGDVGKVEHIELTQDGWMVWSSGHAVALSSACDFFLKRPEPPKVLDADGVEIKVGDEVWYFGTSGPWIVKKMDGDRVACVSPDSTWHSVVHCSRVTHKRPEPPDTWEKLAADIEDCDGSACRYFGRIEEEGRAPCCGCKAYNDETDCTVQVMSDLVRRAKKLAGVE